LDGAIENGKKPMAAIVGGSKVSSKITVLNALLDKVSSFMVACLPVLMLVYFNFAFDMF
jgi:3-phosphoglycerate kinase